MPGGWTASSLKEIKFQGKVKIKAGEIGNIKETQEIIRSYGHEQEPRGQTYPGPAHIIQRYRHVYFNTPGFIPGCYCELSRTVDICFTRFHRQHSCDIHIPLVSEMYI